MDFSQNISSSLWKKRLPVDPTRIFGPQRDSLYVVLPVTVLYTLIFFLGVFGNIFTCIVIIRNKSMHTATNYYLFSLAVSDLLLLVSGMPPEIYSIWVKWPYVFGHTFCVIRGLAAEMSANASVLTITLFTVERYLAICHPFVSHKMSKLSRAVKHVLLLWVAAFSLALPQALQFGLQEHMGVTMCLQVKDIIPHSFEISTFLLFFTPMVVITVLYSFIGLKLKETGVKNLSKYKEDIAADASRTDKIRRKYSQSTRRVIKMLVAVVVAFFVCWAPFHAQRLVAIYGTKENHLAKSPTLLFVYSIVTYISGVFYYMSTCINPIFYHIMSNKFREAFKNTMLLCCCRKRDRNSLQRCSYTAIEFARRSQGQGGSQSAKILIGNSSNKDVTKTTVKTILNKEDSSFENHRRICEVCKSLSASENNSDKSCGNEQRRNQTVITVKKKEPKRRRMNGLRPLTINMDEKRKFSPSCCSAEESSTDTMPATPCQTQSHQSFDDNRTECYMVNSDRYTMK